MYLDYLSSLLLFLPIGATPNLLPLWTPHAHDDEQSLLIGDQPHDLFGWSLALSRDGSTLAVGAIDNDTNGSAAGQVRLYRLSPETLLEVGVIPGQAAGDYSGYSVSLSASGEIVAIGAPGRGAGKVSVHQYHNQSTEQSSSWAQIGLDIELEKSAGSSGLGHAVALLDDDPKNLMLVAGAPYFDNERGLVVVFQYVRGNHSWIETSRLVGDQEGCQFGYSISFAGNILAVGAKNHGNSNHGQVKVFHSERAGWPLAASPIFGHKEGDYFGFSLSLSANGRLLAIGSPYFDSAEQGRDVGLVQVYRLQFVAEQFCDEDTMECSAFPVDLVPLGQNLTGGTVGDLFGYSVAMSGKGNRLVVGARQVHQLTGQVKVYDWETSSSSWKLSALPIDGESKNDQSGFSLAVSDNGETLAIGSPYHDASLGKKANSGQARIFRWPIGSSQS